MIEIQNLSKSFEDVLAVNNVSANISKGCVFGLLGTNGAGKSTLLRMMAGILKPDSGRIRLEGEEIFENAAAKSKISYIGDEQYFFPNSTPAQLEEFYAHIYSGFDRQEFRRLLELFQLNPKRKVNSFSKGMKKQLSLFLGLASGTPYLLCDETFDGLDPVARQAVKSLLASAMAERGLSSVIASHSLRELEDICDHIGLLHQGGLLLSRDLEDMKLSVHKVQAVFPEIISREELSPLEVVSMKQNGRLQTIILRGEREQVEKTLNALSPVFMELLPLSLEEVFISETEVAGYAFRELAL
ncbi:MAG: ABC transporter ATP-binding protein [Firmicutes bacterium]|nr:ABC transporter ATP-binding protein [Bacillota bacterium]